MTTAERQQRKRTAPYVPAKALSEFFDHVRYVREPDGVDSGLLQDYGISPSSSFALLSALKFLGLTDDAGKPTPVFRQLQVGGDEFRDALREVMERAYDDLFARLDVSRDSRAKIVNFFARNYSPATAERATALFLDLCGEAGIQTAAQPRQRRTAQGRTRRTPREKDTGGTKRGDLHDEGGDGGRTEDNGDGRLRSVQLPLSGTEWVTLRGSFPLSESQWKQMTDMLEALKPGLVVRDNGSADEHS